MKFTQMEGQPIYRVVSSSSYANALAFTSRLEEILQKKQQFGLILVREISWGDRQANMKYKDAVMTWLQEYKAMMSTYCLGMAMVVRERNRLQKYVSVAPRLTANLYGCPGAVFPTEEDALGWLQEQMNYYGNKWALTNFE